MAFFSEVASAWKSTKMTRALARICSISFSASANGSSSGGHEDAAHQVEHADRFAGARPADIAAAARRAGREVARPQQLRLARDVVEDFLLVPHMIAGGHHVDAVAEDRVGDVAGHAEAGGGVLDVGDDEVDALAPTSAGMARRAISRPGFPKMSPTNRIRIKIGPAVGRGDADRDRPAAAIVDARQRDAQLARRRAWSRPGSRRRAVRA